MNMTSLLTLLSLATMTPVVAFHLPQPSQRNHHHTFEVNKYRRFAPRFSTPDESDDHESSSLSVPSLIAATAATAMTTKTTDVEDDATVSSLKKLLKRQRADIAITESLLSSISKQHHDQQGDEHNDKVSSFASSMATGFDYGFQCRNEGATTQSSLSGEFEEPKYGPPSNIVSLTMQQFWRNWDAIRGEYKDEEDVELTPRQERFQQRLEKLTLNSTAIWERELEHGPIVAPWVIKAPYLVLCYFLDTVFEGEYTPARFFYLETVARMPYFSYITLLHLYETLGFWRRSADVKRVHFAEELNEYRHLLIMESLGGDQQWWVRFLAQHSAIAYFMVLCMLWLLSPSLSYKFSDLLETHAVNTYGQFLDENEEPLKKLPPPLSAVEYYTMGVADPFYAEFQTSAMNSGSDIRRPGESMKSLYDVFQAIKADEGDHVATMKACLDPNVAVQSPSIERRVLTGVALVAVISLALDGGGLLSGVGFDVLDVASDVSAASSMTSGIGLEGGLFDGVLAGAVAGLQRFIAEDTSGRAAMDEVADAASNVAKVADSPEMLAILAGAARKFALEAWMILQRILMFLL